MTVKRHSSPKQTTRKARKNSRKAAVRAPLRRSDGHNGKHAGNGAAAGKRAPEVRPASPLSQREKLELERREVAEELARLREELRETPEPTGDEVDLSVYDREKTLGLIAGYQRRLDEIEHALRAAQKGAYGICERCGQPIDPARLSIFPEATLCVKCKNEKERLLKRGLL